MKCAYLEIRLFIRARLSSLEKQELHKAGELKWKENDAFMLMGKQIEEEFG